ncbi:MAG: hypothetical protein AAGB22_15505, partial [Bacteroidota bacterium]
ECIDDRAAAFQLFDQCKEWLEARGMEAMEGPINFGEKDKYWGLIVENFDAPPYYQQNYNPEYYVGFFRDYGFQTYYEQLIYFRDIRTQGLTQKFVERAQRLQQNPRFSVCRIDPKRLDKFGEDFRTIYNRAWAQSHRNFAEMSKPKAKAAMKAMKPILDRNLVYFAFYDETPIGFFIGIPNINELFRKVGPNFNLIGKLKFLWYKWRTPPRTFIAVAFGIDPAYQGKGVEGLIFQLMEDHIYKPKWYTEFYLNWIGDFNPKIISIVEDLDTVLFRKMATMHKLFDPERPFARRPINQQATRKTGEQGTAKK